MNRLASTHSGLAVPITLLERQRWEMWTRKCMEYSFRDSAKKKKKKKQQQPAGGNPLWVLSLFLYFFLSLSSQSARQCGTRTRTHALLSYTPPPRTHTHSLRFSSYRHCRFSLSPSLIMSLCSSLPFFYILLLLSAFCIHRLLCLTAPTSLSLSLFHLLVHSLPLPRFLPPFVFLLPLLFSVCAE